MIFKVYILVKLIVNCKFEGFKIMFDEEVVKNGKLYNMFVFQYEGKLYKVDYLDMYWCFYSVGLMGVEGIKIDCLEVKFVEKIIIVYEEI